MQSFARQFPLRLPPPHSPVASFEWLMTGWVLRLTSLMSRIGPRDTFLWKRVLNKIITAKDNTDGAKCKNKMAVLWHGWESVHYCVSQTNSGFYYAGYFPLAPTPIIFSSFRRLLRIPCAHTHVHAMRSEGWITRTSVISANMQIWLA